MLLFAGQRIAMILLLLLLLRNNLLIDGWSWSCLGGLGCEHGGRILRYVIISSSIVGGRDFGSLCNWLGSHAVAVWSADGLSNWRRLL